MMHVSRQHRQIVVPYRADLAALFPHAHQFKFNGENVIALPHTLNETRMLRNLGLPAPSPFSQHYAFPGRNPPFEVQVRTGSLLTTNNRAYVLNGMGTGKTRAAIWAWDWLRQSGEARKLLVVCPLSTMNFVWAREIMDTLPGVRVSVLFGDKERRIKRLREDADVYIINHDGMQVISDELIKRGDIDVVVLDELSAFRTHGSDRSKIARAVVKDKAWVWGMTGSPTPTAPTDAYGLARLITPERAPKSFSAFRNETMTQMGTFRWLPRKDAAQTVAELLQPSVRFSLDDVTELPDLIERTIEVDLGPRQREAYKAFKNEAVALLKSGAATAANGGVVHNKMLQASLGYVYLDNGGVEVLDGQARLDIVDELIEGTQRKAIVFCPFIHAMEGVSKYLSRCKIDFALVSGDTPHKQRDKIFNLFQSTTKFKALVAHPQCMSHGVTLTAADTIIWFGPIGSQEIFTQANARIRRVGQTTKQQIFMLQGTPAERASYNRLRNRRDAQETVLDILADLTRE